VSQLLQFNFSPRGAEILREVSILVFAIILGTALFNWVLIGKVTFTEIVSIAGVDQGNPGDDLPVFPGAAGQPQTGLAGFNR
jgi:hypothetical protein